MQVESTRESSLVSIKVKDIMTTELFVLSPDHNLKDLDTIMNWKSVRHIPVVENNKMVGLITHRDLLKVLVEMYSSLSTNADLRESILVGEVMNKEIFVVYPETPLQEAASIIKEKKLGCLPVVDEQTNSLIGIITEADFVKFFVDQDILTMS
ncbi:CBS domain-containing protein [Halobacteriovorax sp. HLS]|uniref:CBS domain-containing protein n=1 Tax=Halobacteriovorax sp. HLS TaxID=2234000 RepID=UPI000FDC1262|nr:CBS domain-containing protein [Halobacteriovorax sp. HLS]